MYITATRVTNWTRVLNAARMTVHKKALDKEPSDKFKVGILFAEHSPIRLLEFDVVLHDIPYCNAMHFVRHFLGIEKFVATSRENRTGVPRSERHQTDLIDCQFSLNAQACINISRKRLCSCADPKTIQIWKELIDAIGEIEPYLKHVCVRECVYRGFCPEIESCGYSHTSKFESDIINYRTLKFNVVDNQA